MMMIKTINLKKNYYPAKNIEVKVLKGIDLEINSGEKISIAGPSGAGKSTLLHLIGMMDSLTDGELYFNGIDVKGLNENQKADIRKNKIGFMFQLHYLLPEFTVLENVLIPVWDDLECKRKYAMDLLADLGLEKRTGHLPSELSGGEQQRAALARALINEPMVLLADEPTGNLDGETGKKIEDVIFTKCKENNITLLLVTHNIELAKKSDRILNMKDGMLA